jgi:hypothetical protein
MPSRMQEMVLDSCTYDITHLLTLATFLLAPSPLPPSEIVSSDET